MKQKLLDFSNRHITLYISKRMIGSDVKLSEMLSRWCPGFLFIRFILWKLTLYFFRRKTYVIYHSLLHDSNILDCCTEISKQIHFADINLSNNLTHSILALKYGVFFSCSANVIKITPRVEGPPRFLQLILISVFLKMPLKLSIKYAFKVDSIWLFFLLFHSRGTVTA